MSAPQNENLPASGNPPAGAPAFAMRKSGLLARKGLGGAGGKGNMVSPTDNMMSPVTAKLNNAKKMHFSKKAPTTNLTSRLYESATPGSPAASEAGSIKHEANPFDSPAVQRTQGSALAKDDGNPF